MALVRGWLVIQGGDRVLYAVDMYYWMVLGGWSLECANGGSFNARPETAI